MASRPYIPVKVATTRFLVMRGSTYTYKRKIPARFRGAIDGTAQTAWWITIRAASLQEAQIKAARLAEEHDALIARLKRLPPATLLRLKVERVAAAARHKVEEAEGDADKVQVTTSEARQRQIAAIAEALPSLPQSVRDAIKAEGGVERLLDRIDTHIVDQAVVKLSGDDGIGAMALPPDIATMSPERLRAEATELQTWQEIHHRVKEDGSRLEAVARAIGLEKAPTGITISEAAEVWIDKKRRQPATISRIRFVVKRFVEQVGDLPLEEITSRIVTRFLDSVADLPDTAGLPDKVRRGPMPDLLAWSASNPDHPRIMPTTVNQYGSTLKALFTWAERRDLITTNPITKWDRLEDNRGKTEKRRPFKRDELRRLVASANAQWGERSEDTLILLLSLYSGLRISEVAGFIRADLRQDAEAPGWFLDLRHNGFRRLKTKDSERAIPIHPAIEALIVAHSANVPADGLLFPSMGPKISASTNNLSRRFGAIMRHAQISDSLVTWHSFRHSWEDHAKERIPDPGRRYLAGRKESGSARAYGHGPGLAQVVKWVSMLDPLGVSQSDQGK